MEYPHFSNFLSIFLEIGFQHSSNFNTITSLVEHLIKKPSQRSLESKMPKTSKSILHLGLLNQISFVITIFSSFLLIWVISLSLFSFYVSHVSFNWNGGSLKEKKIYLSDKKTIKLDPRKFTCGRKLNC